MQTNLNPFQVAAPLGLRNAGNSRQTTLQKGPAANPFEAKKAGAAKPAKLVSSNAGSRLNQRTSLSVYISSSNLVYITSPSLL